MKRFKFFLVAMIATAMMFSSCKKDEKGDEPTPTPNEKPADVETIKNTEKIVVTAPEVIYPKQYQYVGLATNIDFKWEKPTVKKVSHIYDENTKSYNDTETDFDYTLKYELCFSKDGDTWTKSNKLSEPEFSKTVNLEEDKTYYYKINTYISYGSTTDSLISNYVYEYEDDVKIPFYSTYEQKHHFGVVRSAKNGVSGLIRIEWATGCICKFILYSVDMDEKGNYTYKYFYEYGADKDGYLVFNEEENNYTTYFYEKMAIKYELTGKYNESGFLHIMPIDGSKYVYDGDFNVYDKKTFISGKHCAVLPKGAKTVYLEDMFEYAPSGKLKRYNPCTYTGKMVTFDDWKEFSKGLSEAQFMINYQRLLGQTEENTTFPFLKNGDFVCYDKDFNGVDYESKNFNNSCGLIEVTDIYGVSDDDKNNW